MYIFIHVYMYIVAPLDLARVYMYLALRNSWGKNLLCDSMEGFDQMIFQKQILPWVPYTFIKLSHGGSEARRWND